MVFTIQPLNHGMGGYDRELLKPVSEPKLFTAIALVTAALTVYRLHATETPEPSLIDASSVALGSLLTALIIVYAVYGLSLLYLTSRSRET